MPFAVGIGTIVSIAGIIISLVNPEIRCKIGLISQSCPAKDQLVDLQLLIQTEEWKPIDRVKVLFIPNKGAPETKYTNSDGYVQTKIPSTGDIDIQLSKEGFQTLARTINLGIEPDRNRTYILEKANSSDSQKSSFSPPPTSVYNPSITASSPQNNFQPASSPDLSLSNQSPLFDRECESATPGKSLDEILIKPSNQSVPLGREVLPLLAYMKSSGATIYKSQPVEFVCNLNSSFKELKLVFGVHGENNWARPENKLLFGVYLDGNLAGTKAVVVGSKQEWNLNLQGVISCPIAS